MDLVLPFRLKVAGRDEFRGAHAVSTSFRFRGFLRYSSRLLSIEWTGSAHVQDVGALSVRDDRLPLPTETLEVPVERLRTATFRGGWWRPRLILCANDLQALATVPSEEAGTVVFWIARSDRLVAGGLASALTGAVRSPAPNPDPLGDLRTPRAPAGGPTTP